MKLTLKQILLLSSVFISSVIFGQDSIPLFDYSKSAEYEIGELRAQNFSIQKYLLPFRA